MFVLSKILAFFLKPLGWMAILFLLSLILKSDKWKNRSRISAIILFFFFTNPLISNLMLRAWELPPEPVNTISEPIDIAIVLGGYVFINSSSDQINFTRSVPRLTLPLQEYNKGKIKKLLLSGASGQIMGDKINEARLVKDFLQDLGIPSGDIIVEDQSRNTFENAAFSAKIIRDSFPDASAVVVTSGYHMRRARACFRKQNLDVKFMPTDTRTYSWSWRIDRILIPSHQSLEIWDKLIKEWVGMVYYKMRGFI